MSRRQGNQGVVDLGNEPKSRLSALELAFKDEVGQRIRGEHRAERRLRRIEEICLTPMLSRRIAGPIPWLWRLLGLQWKPRVLSEPQRLASTSQWTIKRDAYCTLGQIRVRDRPVPDNFNGYAHNSRPFLARQRRKRFAFCLGVLGFVSPPICEALSLDALRGD
jgi:hypothetical protein